MHSACAAHKKHGGLPCDERCDPYDSGESHHRGPSILTHVQELPFPLDTAPQSQTTAGWVAIGSLHNSALGGRLGAAVVAPYINAGIH